jgi:transposase
VCESTGNYWIRLHDTLEDNGIDTVLANPIKTKIIAQAKLKDDKVDSNVL